MLIYFKLFLVHTADIILLYFVLLLTKSRGICSKSNEPAALFPFFSSLHTTPSSSNRWAGLAHTFQAIGGCPAARCGIRGPLRGNNHLLYSSIGGGWNPPENTSSLVTPVLPMTRRGGEIPKLRGSPQWPSLPSPHRKVTDGGRACLQLPVW